MDLYSCGLNAHKQLNSKTSCKNLTTFQKTAGGDRVKPLCATLSATVIDVNGQLEYHGYHKSGLSDGMLSYTEGVRSIIGDFEGIHGALTIDGNLCGLELQGTSSGLFLSRTEQRWRGTEAVLLQYVAIAGNGQVAVIITRTCSSYHVPAVSFA